MIVDLTLIFLILDSGDNNYAEVLSRDQNRFFLVFQHIFKTPLVITLSFQFNQHFLQTQKQ